MDPKGKPWMAAIPNKKEVIILPNNNLLHLRNNMLHHQNITVRRSIM